ncbi:M55 family metallopeptidase [Henriciella sp.]|uniref:M55 family metallopeptidase n=1 Tax=Henriciella sp. TaxID=1968823 RepID=UPI00260B66E8|nr:M55 family metallopeptidase [Henriciella sp.]
MKIYISADIEGVAGIASASEANMAMPGDYAPFRQQMAAEVMAASRGAFTAGATEILTKDAHGSGRNLVLSDFQVPEGKSFELIRGWSGHPLGMVQEIDESFSGAVFIGFHCAAGQAGNPLAPHNKWPAVCRDRTQWRNRIRTAPLCPRRCNS